MGPDGAIELVIITTLAATAAILAAAGSRAQQENRDYSREALAPLGALR